MKILERKLHLSILEGHQVTKALLIISEVISRSSPTLKLSHRCWLWKSNCLSRFPSCLFKLNNFFKYTFPCLFSAPEKGNTQIPESWPLILSNGFGSSGDGCCPLGVIALWPQNYGHRRCFLLCHRPSCWAAQEGAGSDVWVKYPSLAWRVQLDAVLGREFALGPQIPLVPGNFPQGYSPWVLLKGKHHNSPVFFVSLVLTN